MSEEQVFAFNALEVVLRGGRYFVRYDAGAHCDAWREDEISEQEFVRLKMGRAGVQDVLLCLQKRLIGLGVDPYVSNWKPLGRVGE